ncbi:hypothetical protein [Sphingomonas sp. 3-13AW]|jgi:hypothetical protein|uniref:hypothetical protein n=1 Tax=Sphingomonas sp. 3-13AW TaxID=3050450 RepID=UPI003BB7A34F
MLRPASPLWLVHPSRVAGLSAKHALAFALFLVLILGATVASVRGGPVPGPRAAIEESDISVHDGVVGALKGGEAYYPATARVLRSGDYPLKPFLAFRLPTLPVVLAALPAGLPTLMLLLLAAATLYAWWRRLRVALARPLPVLAGMLLLAAGVLALLAPDVALFGESWAGLLVALSLAVRREDRWVEAVAIATIAMLIRETAAFYAIAMGLLAFAEGRRREALGWVAGLAVLALVLVFHAQAVAQVVGPLDPTTSDVAGLHGFGFFVRAAMTATALHLLPPALGALLVALALFGWAMWDDPVALRVTVTLAIYAAAIAVFARADSFYWVFLVSPLLLVGLAFVPDGLRDLVRALLDRRRVRVQRVTR